MRILLIALVLTCLCACAARQEQTSAPNCEALYVILPGNFIVDLAAGSKVIIDPAAQEFVLFCTDREAREALENVHPAGDWRIYKLEGKWEDLASAKGNRYILARPAEVLDWIETP